MAVETAQDKETEMEIVGDVIMEMLEDDSYIALGEVIRVCDGVSCLQRGYLTFVPGERKWRTLPRCCFAWMLLCLDVALLKVERGA